MSHCFNLSSKTPPFLLVCCLLLVACWSAAANLIFIFNVKPICKRISSKILLCGFDISIHQLKPEIINTETAQISRKLITHSFQRVQIECGRFFFFMIFVFDICHETPTDKHKCSRVGQN